MATALTQPKFISFDSKSDPPNLFDGTTRLYVSLTCPFAQRAWIARNYKDLRDSEVIAIDLRDKPKWYTEKIYSAGTVPALEHNGKVTGESLDVVKYIDQNFEGPSLFPKEPKKEEATKELLKFSDEVIKQLFTSFRNKDADAVYAEEHIGPILDRLEAVFERFECDGPFFLGQFSAVDITYAPFFEKFEILAPDLLNYNIYKGRPKLENWFKAMKTVDAYTSAITYNPKEVAEGYKKYFGR